MTVNGSFNFGLRVMITRGGLDRTGLIVPGSRATQRYLFRLPAQGVTVAQAKHELNKVFPESQVVDYRESNPTVTRGLDIDCLVSDAESRNDLKPWQRLHQSGIGSNDGGGDGSPNRCPVLPQIGITIRSKPQFMNRELQFDRNH